MAGTAAVVFPTTVLAADVVEEIGSSDDLAVIWKSASSCSLLSGGSWGVSCCSIDASSIGLVSGGSGSE